MGEQAPAEIGTFGIVDAEGVRAWLAAALEALGAHRAAIDSLNVFPIADGDTGTNMFLTMESCWEAIQSLDAQESLVGMTDAMASAALLGARGNSGVITAEALRGICDVLARSQGMTTVADLAGALRAASNRARAAVAHPVEGTILTVADAAARAAESALDRLHGDDQSEESDILRDGVLGISESMHHALSATTGQLEVLARAGVVDAGAQGLVLIYDALLDQLSGVRRRVASVTPRRIDVASDPVDAPESSATGDFEVMFLCEADEATVARLKEVLDSRGDSLVVSGGPDLWNVHVHVDDAGETIEAVHRLVRARDLRISHLPSQAWAHAVAKATETSTRRTGRGVVAQVHGPGVRALVEQGGVTVVAGRPDRRPSTAEILAAIEVDGHEEVVLLPSDGDTIPVAEVAAEQARKDGVRVSVIPTRSIVQTLSALAVHDPHARFDDVVVAMADAARATRYGAITVATKEALTSAGHCQVGDVLGLVEGDIVEIGAEERDIAAAVLNRLMSTGGELVTAVVGSDADPQVVEHLRATIMREHPGVDLEVIGGGQPLWPLIMGVE